MKYVMVENGGLVFSPKKKIKSKIKNNCRNFLSPFSVAIFIRFFAVGDKKKHP
jgi:hypothetical protein